MSKYIEHAMQEFRAAGWIDENDKFNCEMQEMLCNHVMHLLDVFGEEGHSSSSAPYAIELFRTLAMFEPIGPLTGEDWEWRELPSGVWQNKRCSRVFKDDTGAYDINGKVFYEWYRDPESGEVSKSYYTSNGSRVYIKFPYTPATEYVAWTPGDENE